MDVKAGNMKISNAQQTHVAALVSLKDVVHLLHAREHPDIFKYPLSASEIGDFFLGLLSSDANHILIAEEDEHVVGYVWAAIEHKKENAFMRERKTVYIHEIAVHPNYRQKGIGRELLDGVHSLAQKLNINTVGLDTWAFNSGAQAFFKNSGFEVYNLKLWRRG
jgi:ribosomal protein S18 acetylase RimI-like enzyme